MFFTVAFLLLLKTVTMSTWKQFLTELLFPANGLWFSMKWKPFAFNFHQFLLVEPVCTPRGNVFLKESFIPARKNDFSVDGNCFLLFITWRLLHEANFLASKNHFLSTFTFSASDIFFSVWWKFLLKET